MRRRLRRLRWQLTLSHLIAIAVTLIGMIGAAVLIATLLLALHHGSSGGAVDDAQRVAETVGSIVQQHDTADLNGVLHALAAGTLRSPAAFGYGGTQWARNSTQSLDALHNVAYIVVVSPNGELLGSSDAAAAADAAAAPWSTVARAALRGDRSSASLQAQGTGSVRVFGAYPVLDAQQQPIAAVVVAETALPPPAARPTLLNMLAIFGAASIVVLLGASVFALLSSSLVAYLLSRRLVTRLERLGEAARALAAGDLGVRVAEGRDDELGDLALQFNRMSCDLQRMLDDLAAERDRVRGVLENRRQLVVGISHELRTPIATVHGYLEAALLDEAALPQPLRTDLVTMERELTRLQRLVDDLFTLSRADVGRLDLLIAPVDVCAIVRRTTVSMAALAWRQRRVDVVADLPDEPLIALADAGRIEQIVINLLANAVQHTPPGGLVAAAVHGEAGAICIEVRDTGSGIAAADLARVFERFYRGQTAGDAGGVGLGLALVKELAEAMHGRVEASSTPGEGSCFAVRLPRV
jgi:signal transduction histidine kinase